LKNYLIDVWENIKIIYNLLYKFQIENNITNYDNIIIDSKNINNDIEIYKKILLINNIDIKLDIEHVKK